MKDDRRHGKLVEWYENGKKKSQGFYNDGENHGKMRIISNVILIVYSNLTK